MVRVYTADRLSCAKVVCSVCTAKRLDSVAPYCWLHLQITSKACDYFYILPSGLAVTSRICVTSLAIEYTVTTMLTTVCTPPVTDIAPPLAAKGWNHDGWQNLTAYLCTRERNLKVARWQMLPVQSRISSWGKRTFDGRKKRGTFASASVKVWLNVSTARLCRLQSKNFLVSCGHDSGHQPTFAAKNCIEVLKIKGTEYKLDINLTFSLGIQAYLCRQKRK